MSKSFFKLFFLVLCGTFCRPTVQNVGKNRGNENDGYDYDYYDFEYLYENDTMSEVNALLYKTAKKFYCRFRHIENSELIVYGTRSWTFPKQNVNLTLSFPTEGQPSPSLRDPEEQYIITGFNVVLFADAEDSQGYITSGGMLQESIGLTFICNDVTILVYEFWLYGIPKNTTIFTEASAAVTMMELNDICSPTMKYGKV